MQVWYKIMQVSEKTEATRIIGVLLFESFSNHCLANAIEPFRAANTIARKELYSWEHLSPAGGTVTSSSGLPVETSSWQEAKPAGDFLFIMPSYGFKGYSTPRIHEMLRAARSRFRLLAGLDTGAWLLAGAGLLDGRRATIHWDEMAAFAEAFPEVEVLEDRFVQDGGFATCGGATTTLELMLDIIARDHSPIFALEVAALFMHGGDRDGHELLPNRSQNNFIRRATALMRRNIEAPLSIPDLAARLDVDQRKMESRFQAEFSMTPAAVYKAIRLREARRLSLVTDLSVAEIAVRCGYRNASAMTRAYRAEFGTTPRADRRLA
jgi:AraC family carnitine catabolism transcriptional activator